MTTEEYPSYLLASKIFPEEQRPCEFCRAILVKGFTNKGNPSWFDCTPPHVNHWATCSQRAVAKRYFRRRSSKRR